MFIDEGQDSAAEMVARNAAHGLVASGVDALPLLIAAFAGGGPRVRKYAVYALGQLGAGDDASLDALRRGSADEDAYVRINAVEALGIVPATQATVDALAAALADADDEVRFNAALALARVGPPAASAVDALANALYDGNRYVAGYATHALERIGTTEAFARLVPYLQDARWCPLTTTDSLF